MIFPSLSSTLLITLVSRVTGFASRSWMSQPQSPTSHHFHRQESPLAARFRDQDDLVFEDDEIVFKKIEIEREWNYKGFQSYGKMDVDLLVPEDGKKAKGAIFFMHGFSQAPVAYRATLKRVAEAADVAVVAVESSLTDRDGITRDQANAPEGIGRDARQYALQRVVAQDTAQCIRMALDGDECFRRYLDKRVPMGVAGHSMGGGLCFAVAAEFKEIEHLFAMAPAAGVEEFNPMTVLQGSKGPVAKSALVMGGGWDLLAKASAVQEMAALSNDKIVDSALYALVKRGLHTGFQDKIVLFGLPLSSIVSFLAVLICGVLEFVIVKIFSILRTETGQLEGTRELFEYFVQQMVLDKAVTLEEAQERVQDVGKEITFAFPEDNRESGKGPAGVQAIQ